VLPAEKADRAVPRLKFDDKSAAETEKTPRKPGRRTRKLSSNFAPRKSALKGTRIEKEIEKWRNHLVSRTAGNTAEAVLRRFSAVFRKRLARATRPANDYQ